MIEACSRYLIAASARSRPGAEGGARRAGWAVRERVGRRPAGPPGAGGASRTGRPERGWPSGPTGARSEGQRRQAERRGVDRAGRGVEAARDAQPRRAGARVGDDLGRVGLDRLAGARARSAAGSASASGAWRLPRGAPPERSCRKRLTTRSSSEWKVTTASQPPGASARSAAARPRASSPSSSLTAMRSAWKLRVAACGWPGFGRGSSRSIRPASCSVVVKGADRRSATMARAMRREARSSPYWKRMSASAASGRPLTRSAAAGAGLAHPHVERPVLLEGEAARGLVELHRGDADVEHDAVERRMPGLRGDAVERPEGAGAQVEPAGEVAGPGFGAGERLGVAVDADHQGRRRPRAAPRA